MGAIVAAWQRKYPDVVVHTVLTQGLPVETILGSCAGADLLVVGGRGEPGFPDSRWSG